MVDDPLYRTDPINRFYFRVDWPEDSDYPTFWINVWLTIGRTRPLPRVLPSTPDSRLNPITNMWAHLTSDGAPSELARSIAIDVFDVPDVSEHVRTIVQEWYPDSILQRYTDRPTESSPYWWRNPPYARQFLEEPEETETCRS